MSDTTSTDRITTPVEVVTRHHRYAGLVMNRGSRIADMLNDSSSDILEMSETVAGTGGESSGLVRSEHFFLKKDRILLAIPKGPYEAPEKRFNRYKESCRYGAVIVLPGCVLSGILHLPRLSVPSVLLTDETSFPSFIAMTHVTVHDSMLPLTASQFDVVIFQRPCVEALELSAQPLPRVGDGP